MEQWPNFFIVGTAKAGTTTLHEYLKKIPEIYMSPLKEPNYFALEKIPENYFRKPIRSKEKYFSLFNNVKKQRIIGESSVNYLADSKAPKLIHQVSPNAHILISLRDPVERVYSEYFMHRRGGHLNPIFLEQIKFELNNQIDYSKHNIGLTKGLYSEYVKRYFSLFGKNKVKIIIFEEFIKHQKQTVEEILEFLGIPHSLTMFDEEAHRSFSVPRNRLFQLILGNITIINSAAKFLPQSSRTYLREQFLVTKKPKPKMDEDARKILINYYKEDVEKLKHLLDRKLPWENFSN